MVRTTIGRTDRVVWLRVQRNGPAFSRGQVGAGDGGSPSSTMTRSSRSRFFVEAFGQDFDVIAATSFEDYAEGSEDCNRRPAQPPAQRRNGSRVPGQAYPRSARLQAALGRQGLDYAASVPATSLIGTRCRHPRPGTT